MASIGSASSLQCRDLGNQSLPLLDLLSSLSLIISSFLVEDRRSQETKVIGRTSVLFFCFFLSLSLMCRDLGFHRFREKSTVFGAGSWLHFKLVHAFGSSSSLVRGFSL
uniref:Uncharacterized protein n=1 Tax=Cannabis sativa TaxID=3483 RepID=A0A803R3Q1_CANSA